MNSTPGARSVFTAVAGSYVALDLAGRGAAASQPDSHAMGISVWAMHNKCFVTEVALMVTQPVNTQLRRTGIGVVGDVPWGTHFFMFYESQEDLLDALVPYFKTGLEAGEFCVWVISEPLTERDVKNALQKAVPEFDRYLADCSIEILRDCEFYPPGNELDPERVARTWAEKMDTALARGYAGLRGSGCSACMERRYWQSLCDYEEELNNSISNWKMTILCTFPLAGSTATEILDVTRTHQFAIARRNRAWEVVETSELKQAKSEIQRLNDQLEERVAERTSQLEAANQALQKAFHEIKGLRDQLYKENLVLKEQIGQASMFEEIIGSSAALRRVLVLVGKVAPTDSTVLITGETGTGKELVARAIHQRSNRATQAFVSVNCAAMPPSLVASELFGYEKGAFTGADERRLGRFELADGGTIFLDEIGDLPSETQIALLRVLQERVFERVGGSQPIPVDVRILAATHRDLQATVEVGTFRQDLFYRLNVFPIHVPPLRDRVEDIPLLVEYFAEQYAGKAGKKIKSIKKKTLELLQTYDWPGNIRELQNVIERAVILIDGDTLAVDETWLEHESASLDSTARGLGRPEEDREREMIESALRETRGRVSGPGGAAAKLGVPRSTLESRIRSLGIDKQVFKLG